MQTAPSGAVWTLSDSSSELLTALLELLTAVLELLTAVLELLTAVLELLTARQSCSERVVIIRIVRVDGPAGPL